MILFSSKIPIYRKYANFYNFRKNRNWNICYFFKFKLDTNQDGKLNPKELESLITAKTSSHDLKNVDAAVLARHLIKCADENDDELLDFEEFYKIYCDENFWIKGLTLII